MLRLNPGIQCMNAVMDILARVDHEYLATVTSEPGGCTPVSPAEMQALLQRTAEKSALKRCASASVWRCTHIVVSKLQA